MHTLHEELIEKMRQQDEEAEYQMRLQLREALAAALEYITSDDRQVFKTGLVEMIRQTLEDTAP